MLPISWPVSVVLAVLLSIIHLSCRIVMNSNDILFIEKVGKYAQHNTRSQTLHFPSKVFLVRLILLKWSHRCVSNTPSDATMATE